MHDADRLRRHGDGTRVEHQAQPLVPVGSAIGEQRVMLDRDEHTMVEGCGDDDRLDGLTNGDGTSSDNASRASSQSSSPQSIEASQASNVRRTIRAADGSASTSSRHRRIASSTVHSAQIYPVPHVGNTTPQNT